jgi:hypothetical protein
MVTCCPTEKCVIEVVPGQRRRLYVIHAGPKYARMELIHRDRTTSREVSPGSSIAAV